MSRRLVAVVAAVLLAGVATVALVSYLRGIEREALAAVETVEVFVARDTIPAGTSGEEADEQGLVESDTAPRGLIPEGAITGLAEIEGRVAAVDVLEGEVILSQRFVAPTEARDRVDIPEGMQAMSFEVGVPPGVAGFIQTGDTISILAQLAVEDAPAVDDEEELAPGEGERLEYLLQNVQVLNVGQRVVVTDEEGERDDVRQDESRVLLTVAVEPVDAEKLAFGVINGTIWLTLVPEDQEPADTPGRTLQNAFE